MRYTLLGIGVFLIVTTAGTGVHTFVAEENLIFDPPFWEGDVYLVENSTLEVTAHNSGKTYRIRSTTALGSLDTASTLGNFDYTVNDEWYEQFGALLVDSIAGAESQGIDGWQFWVNYPDEPLPWIGADAHEVTKGDVVDFFYGGYGVTPDTASMLLRMHIHVIEDNMPPFIEITKPKSGGLYIFDREIIVTTRGYTVVFGKLTVEVNTVDELSTIGKVEFYVDNILKATVTEKTYNWHWDESAIGSHALKAIAYDEIGNSNEMERIILIFSL